MNKRRYFLVGIKGVGMASVAVILSMMGHDVLGADVKESFITDDTLKKTGIQVVSFDNAQKYITKNTICVYSASHNGYQNRIINHAVHKGCTIMHQADIVQQISTQCNVSIAVAGCHGKTTTTGLLATSLRLLIKKISYMIGTSHGGFFGGNEYFIYEADEYAIDPPRDKTPKIMKYYPDYVVITNIDFDHPDVYRDIQHTIELHHLWFTQIISYKPHARIIVNGDDNNVRRALKNIPSRNVITVGFSRSNMFMIKSSAVSDCSVTKASIIAPGNHSYLIETQLSGKHNISNVALSFVTLLQLGLNPESARKALARFSGSKRRMELVYSYKSIFLLDDYAHHPSEIQATLTAIQCKYPGKKIYMIFQPHTYSRTKALYDEFIDSFRVSDYCYILPIFSSAREDSKDFSINSKQLVQDALKKNVAKCFYVEDKKELQDLLKQHISDDSVIVTMGAGDIYKTHDTIITAIKTV